MRLKIFANFGRGGSNNVVGGPLIKVIALLLLLRY